MLNLIDLAGSERLSRSLASGDRLKETQAINKSLFNLQACLRELRWNQQNATDKEPRNVPYRASKVSHLVWHGVRASVHTAVSMLPPRGSTSILYSSARTCKH